MDKNPYKKKGVAINNLIKINIINIKGGQIYTGQNA